MTGQIGKLELGLELDRFLHDYVERRRLHLLPIELTHIAAYDRLLVAQATALGVPIVTADPNLRRYEVEVVW